MQGLEVVEDLLQARGEQEGALVGQLAHEELEHRRLRHALAVVGLQHGQLVEVGQQRVMAHPSVSSVIGDAPAAVMRAMAASPSPGCTSTARIASLSSSTSKFSRRPSSTVLSTQ